MKWIILALFVFSAIYMQRRGKVRVGFMRQLSDHSTFMGPINLFMYFFSKVPLTPYLSTDEFPELQKLKDNWNIIAEESLKMQAAGHIKQSMKKDDAGFNSFFKTGWKRFYLKWYNTSHPSAAELCPVTTQLLNEIPSVKAAMFAELPPEGRLVRHRDPYAGSLRYHLGLVTPNDDDCYIDVDGERYSWRDGEAVLFDETYLHYAENKTTENRIILFCDIERPMRYRWAQKVNDWIGRHLVAAASSPNTDADKTGFINKAFKYIYAVRPYIKRFKKWNRKLYYVAKFILFAALLVLIFHLY